MPDAPDSLIARAAAHYRGGEHDAAAQCALDIIAQAPEHFDALHLLGVLCLDSKLVADAVAYLARAARLQPKNPQLNVNRSNAWLALDQFSLAEAAARQVLAVHPDNSGALNNLALALGKQDRREEGIEAYRAALARKPEHAPAYYNMAKMLETLGRLDEAEASYRAALLYASVAAPSNRIADILNGLGGVLTALDRPEEALALLRDEQARRTEPLDLTWCYSLLHLKLGDFESGWREYESRWGIAGHDKPHAGASIPDIAGVSGKRILLVGEQGRGDIVQFARYASLLADRGATVYMSVYDDLKSLLSTVPGVTKVVGEDELEPVCDIVAQLLSLPLAFGTKMTTIPDKVPYLRADPDRVARWKSCLDLGPMRQIGLAWSSANPGATRSTNLTQLLPLLECPNVAFHALQKEIGDVDLAFLQADGRIRDHRASLTDFAETAALIEALDLVITIDTAVAHVAGALGKPVWIMLPHAAEWRWLRHRTDSPWYPTASLYRQPAPGDWSGLAVQIAVTLGD